LGLRRGTIGSTSRRSTTSRYDARPIIPIQLTGIYIHLSIRASTNQHSSLFFRSFRSLHLNVNLKKKNPVSSSLFVSQSSFFGSSSLPRPPSRPRTWPCPTSVESQLGAPKAPDQRRGRYANQSPPSMGEGLDFPPLLAFQDNFISPSVTRWGTGFSWHRFTLGVDLLPNFISRVSQGCAKPLSCREKRKRIFFRPSMGWDACMGSEHVPLSFLSSRTLVSSLFCLDFFEGGTGVFFLHVSFISLFISINEIDFRPSLRLSSTCLYGLFPFPISCSRFRPSHAHFLSLDGPMFFVRVVVFGLGSDLVHIHPSF